MADPKRLDLLLHPCNVCGTAPDVTWYSWRDPGYRARCSGCLKSQAASTPEALQSQWDHDNPSTDVASLRHSAEQREARVMALTALLTQRLTPEVLEMLIAAFAEYAHHHDCDHFGDFDPADFIKWRCTMGNKPCPADTMSALLEEPLYG